MPRMRSPQELLRVTRRELLSRSPRSSSPLERSEPIALMERGRTCGLFFRPPQRPSPRQSFPTATASPAVTIPYGNCPRSTSPFGPELSRRWTMAANVRRPHRAPPPARRPPPRRHPHAAVRSSNRPRSDHPLLQQPSPRQLHPPRRPMKLASIPHAAAALRGCLARIAPYAFSFRRMHAISPLPGNVCPKCMLFEIGMARSSPYASISRCNRVVLDTWRKDLARKAPFSRQETRNHAWHEDAARAFGLQSGQKNRIPQTGILSMSSSVLLNACPTPCNLCTRQRNLRFPAWKN